MTVASVHQLPLALMVQGWFCHRDIARINAAEATKHCGGTNHFTVLIASDEQGV